MQPNRGSDEGCVNVGGAGDMTGNDDMFRPVAANDEPSAKPPRAQWVQVVPVPESAGERPEAHRKNGAPSLIHRYHTADGHISGYVCRFDLESGRKVYSGLVYCKNLETGICDWCWKNFASPMPLYNLHLLEKYPDKPVVVVEGEKAADALNTATSPYVAVTSPQGAKSAHKADWRPLRGRNCKVWPDNDGPGQVYAEAVCGVISTLGGSASIVELPPGLEAGFDAADAVAAGWSGLEIEQFLDKVRPSPTVVEDHNPEDQKANRSGKSKPARDLLHELVEGLEFWQCQDRNAYATVEVNGALENFAVRSADFRDYLIELFFRVFGKAPGKQAIEDALSTIQAKARINGITHTVFRRVGHANENIYFDLGDKARSIIEISQNDYHIVRTCPVKFLRSSSMRPLPLPERGESIDVLRNYVNMGSENDFKMTVAWLIVAMMPNGPYPILAIDGQQGSAKSTTANILRFCIDPVKAPLRSLPQDERNLVIAAQNAHISCYDNLSGMSNDMSDALCRMSTGGGFAIRKLHTNDEEMVFDICVPIMLNGIVALGSRPDLADRAIAITLPTIAPGDRKTESDLFEGFNRDLPEILGALFTGVSSALRNLSNTDLPENGRMADFCKWVTAAEPGLGWEKGEFMQAYEENHSSTVRGVIEDDPVVEGIMKLVCDGDWQGTPSELWGALLEGASEQPQRSRTLPKSPSVLGRTLKRLAPALMEIGIECIRLKGGAGSTRSWKIGKIGR